MKVLLLLMLLNKDVVTTEKIESNYYQRATYESLMIETVEYSNNGMQVNFSDGSGYWLE